MSHTSHINSAKIKDTLKQRKVKKLLSRTRLTSHRPIKPSNPNRSTGQTRKQTNYQDLPGRDRLLHLIDINRKKRDWGSEGLVTSTDTKSTSLRLGTSIILCTFNSDLTRGWKVEVCPLLGVHMFQTKFKLYKLAVPAKFVNAHSHISSVSVPVGYRTTESRQRTGKGRP